jgi:hypothetical protein
MRNSISTQSWASYPSIELIKGFLYFLPCVRITFFQSHLKKQFCFFPGIKTRFPCLYDILYPAALLLNFLGLISIIPKTGSHYFLFKLSQFFLLAVYIKDAPLRQGFDL